LSLFDIHWSTLGRETDEIASPETGLNGSTGVAEGSTVRILNLFDFKKLLAILLPSSKVFFHF